MKFPSCPLKSGGLYKYYKQELARVSTEVKKLERRIIADSLSSRPELADNPRWRQTRKFKPHEILRLIGGGGFYIRLHPIHAARRDGVEISRQFIAYLLHDPNYQFPERK